MTGSVDGHVRTYDLRKGELRADYLGRGSNDLMLLNPFSVSLSQERLFT